jgi:hypothetical protein
MFSPYGFRHFGATQGPFAPQSRLLRPSASVRHPRFQASSDCRSSSSKRLETATRTERSSGMATWRTSCGHGQLWGKKIAIVGIGSPQIDRKVIYHFNRIFLFYLFGGYYMLLEYCIPYWSLFFGSPADLSWMMDALWQFDIAMKNGPFIWFITYQEYPKIVVFHGKR